MNRELTPGEILDLLNIKINELANLNLELDKWAQEKDNLEKEYKRQLSIKLLQLRSERIPVAIIQDIAKGSKEINELRYQRDSARSNYSIIVSAISNKRLEIETLRSRLTWLRAERNNS